MPTTRDPFDSNGAVDHTVFEFAQSDFPRRGPAIDGLLAVDAD